MVCVCRSANVSRRIQGSGGRGRGKKAMKIHNRAELYYQLSNSLFHLKDENKAKEALDMALVLDSSIAEDMKQKISDH